jgi:SAM-dependent methyltransferase
MWKLKELVDSLFYPVYLLRGRIPWTLGYYTAKKLAIQNAIDNDIFQGTSDIPLQFGSRIDERVVEYPWVYSRLHDNPGVVLDAGSALNYQFLLDRKPIADSNLTICTLSPEKRSYWKRSISYVFGDLRNTNFRDASFDVVISISTIEHIGLDNTLLYTEDRSKKETDKLSYLSAVGEFKRLLKPGGTCFITVPYGQAKNHGWFQVFDASMVELVLDAFNPAQSELAYFAYTESGWTKSDKSSLQNATFFDIHSQKKFDADIAAGARGVVCMRMVA